MEGKHRKFHPLDIDSDDHSNESSNPTLLDRLDDEDDLEGVGEDKSVGEDGVKPVYSPVGTIIGKDGKRKPRPASNND